MKDNSAEEMTEIWAYSSSQQFSGRGILSPEERKSLSWSGVLMDGYGVSPMTIWVMNFIEMTIDSPWREEKSYRVP